MHIFATALKNATLVYYRIQWGNMHVSKHFFRHCNKKSITVAVQQFLQLQRRDRAEVQGEQTCRSTSDQPLLTNLEDLLNYGWDAFLQSSNFESYAQIERSSTYKYLALQLTSWHVYLHWRFDTCNSEVKCIGGLQGGSFEILFPRVWNIDACYLSINSNVIQGSDPPSEVLKVMPFPFVGHCNLINFITWISLHVARSVHWHLCPCKVKF